MGAKKNVAEAEEVATCCRSCVSKLNSTCDVTNLDQFGPISVHDV